MGMENGESLLTELRLITKPLPKPPVSRSAPQLVKLVPLFLPVTRLSVSRSPSTTDSLSTILMTSTSHSPSRHSSCHLPVPATMEPTLSLHTRNKPKRETESLSYHLVSSVQNSDLRQSVFLFKEKLTEFAP